MRAELLLAPVHPPLSPSRPSLNPSSSFLQFLEPGADPLSLEGFLAQERRLVDASEAQHIHNKMLYDAVNEALLGIYRAANRVQVRA